MRLRLEVAVLEHAGHLDDAAQLDLAPAPADVRPVAERADEVARLAAQLLLRLGELPHLRRELRVRARARDLELLELAVDLRERLLDRRDEVLDRLLALVEILRSSSAWSCSSCDFASSRNDSLLDASASAASAVIVASSEPRASSSDAEPRGVMRAQLTSQAPVAPSTRPMRIPAMTIGPTNAREGVGRHRAAARTMKMPDPTNP